MAGWWGTFESGEPAWSPWLANWAAKVCWGLSHHLAAIIRHLLAMSPSTSQVPGNQSWAHFVCPWNPQRLFSCSLLNTEGTTPLGGQCCLMGEHCTGLETEGASAFPLLRGLATDPE